MEISTNAVVMREVGAPDVLEYRAVTLEFSTEGSDVLVRLEAASVNPADTFFRQLGTYVGDGRGCVLGHDGAGVVDAVGDAVRDIQVGDRVCFCNGGLGGDAGTYSHHAVVPEELLAKIPDSVTMEDAAAIPLVFITGWEALRERARVATDERVLIHGGTGGTGHIAIQIAKELGATVATTVSSSEKADFALGYGADIAINYREENFVDAVNQWSGENGVQAVLDNAGTEVFHQSLRVLAPYGHLVTLMGTPGDLEDETAYNNNLTIHNVMMLTPMWKGLGGERRRQAAILRVAMNWLADKRISVQIRERFALEDVASAHRMLEHGSNTGKIVLTM